MNTTGKQSDPAETLARIALAAELTAHMWTESVTDDA